MLRRKRFGALCLRSTNPANTSMTSSDVEDSKPAHSSAGEQEEEQYSRPVKSNIFSTGCYVCKGLLK